MNKITESIMPLPTQLTAHQIEAEAVKISNYYGFDPTSESVRELAERISESGCVKVLPIDEIEHLDSGSLEVRGPGDFNIYLSPITSRVRDNFTIAHELGHYFLHSGNPPGTDPITVGRSGEVTPIEKEANRFAAALLMPQDQFSQYFDRTNGNILSLAGIFSVSRPAVEVRIRSLGLK